jgi:hypothetical protein
MTNPDDDVPAANAPESDGLEQAETLRGDIRDMMLREVKSLGAVWEDLSDLDRSLINDRVNQTARQIVYGALEIVHAEGAPSLDMIVKSVNFKKEVNASLTGASGETNRHLLADAVGREVMVIIPDAGRLMGERPPEDQATDNPADQDHLDTAASAGGQ